MSDLLSRYPLLMNKVYGLQTFLALFLNVLGDFCELDISLDCGFVWMWVTVSEFVWMCMPMNFEGQISDERLKDPLQSEMGQ